MKVIQIRGVNPVSRGRARAWFQSRRAKQTKDRGDAGFSLIELVIVTAILPLVVGGLSVGLLAVFSLQTGVSNRLADTGDSQVVSSNFENDVQSAAQITTVSNFGYSGNDQCGPNTQVQLMGLEWNPNTTGGGYQTIVSYAEVKNGSTYSLVRQYCSGGFSTTPTTSTVISYNMPIACSATITTNCQSPPTILPGSSNAAALIAWTSTQQVTNVQLEISEPNTTETNGSFSYTLAAVPADSAQVIPSGSAITPSTTTGCGFASPGTGTYASTMCLVDFSSLTGNNLLAAEQGCLEMSVPLPGGSTLYFCIGITGTAVQPSPLPTWQNAFLGNSCAGSTSCANGTPFYTGIPGDPALYQTGSGLTTITIKGITVLNAQGLPATGWQAVGADAESTDEGESIAWTANTPLTIMNNGQSYDSQTDPVGNACDGGSGGGSGLTYSNNNLTVTCAVPSTVSVGLKTGAAMVWAATPNIFTTTLVGGGLEAMAFGLLLS